MSNYSRDPASIVVRDDTCPIPCKDGGTCGRPAVEEAPFPICEQHIIRFLRWQQHRSGSQREALPSRQKAIDLRQVALEAQAVVYYVQLNGGNIKIGTTTNLTARLTGLRLSASAVLATEPGSYDLERIRHTQFRADRVSRLEDFRPSPALMSHIAMVRAHFGGPTITTEIPMGDHAKPA